MKKIKNLVTGSFWLLCTIMVYGQSPGGVEGSQAWFKTNRISNTVFNWQDYSGDDSKLNSWNTKNEYSNAGRYFNFNAGLYFDGGSRQFFLSRTNLAQGTIIGLFGYTVTNFNSENTLFGITGRENESALITNDKIVNSAERGAEILDYGSTDGEDLYRKQDNSEGNDAKYRERSLKIVSYYQYQQPNISVWGEDQSSNLTLGYAYLNRANGLSTYSMSSFGNNFYGYIPELLVYSRVLTPLERRKAETYLALKYGVSLSNSYIASDDKLLWDYDANKTYNNRITGILRDDTSGLNQLSSTTSYEEATSYSDSNDSYYDPNYRDQSSRYRLLVIGQSPGNTLQDKNATLWGDDNGDLSTKNTGGIAGIKRMTRTWKLVTNTAPPTTEQKTLLFNNTGLQADTTLGQATFTNSVASSTGVSVTTVPLSGSDGYLEFKTLVTGTTMIIKFGTQNGEAGTYDYGVKVNPNGDTYTIENTQKPALLHAMSANMHTVTMEKKGNEIFINIYNNLGEKHITTKKLTILPADADKKFYGVVSIEKKNTDVSLTVSHGGFSATGSKVELSYDASRAAEFENNAANSFLIIDRSGTGDFGTETTEYYPVSDIDKTRRKIIFNNVIWDADSNGKDVFSFGYKDPTVKLIALEEGINPTCVDGVLQQDGKINIEMKEGIPGYKYTLNKTGNATVLQTGTFYESKKTLQNLEAGNYDLTLEMIGTNFEKTGGTAVVAVAATNALPIGTTGSLEWGVIDLTADKYIGFISQRTTRTTAMLNYGVVIKQNKLYFWNKGVTGVSALATLIKGSKIKIQLEAGILSCTVDDVIVGSQNLASADAAIPYYPFIGLDAASNAIYNVVTTGFVTSPAKMAWGTATYLNILEGDAAASKVVQKIELTAPQCQKIEPPVPPLVNDNLIVAPVPSKAGANFNINVKLNKPSEVMVLIFNTAGVLISQLRNPNPQETTSFTTSIPTSGIYIIKVLTAEGEFSKSIIIN